MNPAEKIRQVFQENIDVFVDSCPPVVAKVDISENEILHIPVAGIEYIADRERMQCLLVNAQLKLLDAIIDWKSQRLRTLKLESKDNTDLYCSVLLDKLHLEQARTSLTTTL